MALTAKQEPFYVYELIDPRDGSVFYVGKGKGNRVSQHARAARQGRIDNVEKFRRIKAIHDAGLAIGERIVSRHDRERDAYTAEREHIAELRGSLTNIVGGVVSNDEAAQEMAKVMLDRMKPFDHWMATIRPHQLAAVEKHFGGARGFYDDSRAFYSRIAGA